MTAIIVIKDGKRVMMGADSVSTAGLLVTHIKNPEEFKINRVDGSPSCLVGASGMSSFCKRITKTAHLLDDKNNPNINYMVKYIVPKIFALARKENAVKTDKDGNTYLEGTILFVTKSHIYKIFEYGEVFEYTNFASIGCGSRQLEAKYLSLRDRKDISLRDKVLSCLENAVKYGTSIGYPLVMMSNDPNEEMEIINEENVYQ